MRANSIVSCFPPLFGSRRKLECPPLERFEFQAGDGATLTLYHTSGGSRGPVLLAPGTAMTSLTFCIDTVPQNLVEFLVERGFDTWLFDWRTSPLLDAHTRPYTLDDVARYDWPVAVAEVQRLTGEPQVGILAHCLSSACLGLSLVRGYLCAASIRSFVASQVIFHFNMTPVTRLKLATFLDRLLPSGDIVHEKKSERDRHISDLAISFLARVLPKSYSCANPSCYRQSATWGDLLFHPSVDDQTHSIMGDLIPECKTAFLKDAATWGRKTTVLRSEDRLHLDRLRLPTFLFSGRENRMFLPSSTAKTYDLLCEANGPELYRRKVYEGFGHLDCYVGHGASVSIWPDIADALVARA
jgi:cholesterol oxidase